MVVDRLEVCSISSIVETPKTSTNDPKGSEQIRNLTANYSNAPNASCQKCTIARARQGKSVFEHGPGINSQVKPATQKS